MSAIKDYILRDVQKENESNKPAIVLRLSALGMMGYCLLLGASILWGGDHNMLALTAPFLILYGFVFILTYHRQVIAAAYGLNFFTIFWIILSLQKFGWDLGVQHFLFVLLLIDFFLPFWSLKIKLLYVAALCMLRIALFFYCKINTPQFIVPVNVIYYYQVTNTISIFLMLSICGCLISSNFIDLEKKLIETNKKLLHQAGTDPLTQLMNRLSMMEYAAQQMAHSTEKGISVAIGDIDHFKKFNDTYGHECGDAVLKTLAGLFKKTMQPYGAAARWGGEEFLFLFRECNGDEAYMVLSKLQDDIRKLDVQYGELHLRVTMTFGLTEIDRAYSFDDSVREADQLLYTGKENGRNQIVY